MKDWINGESASISDLVIVFESWCKQFLTSDLDGFISSFQINISNEYYLKRWFSGYIQKVVAPVKVEFDQEELKRIEENCYICRVIFYLTYAVYEKEEVCFELRCRMENGQITFTSVNINHINHINHQWVLDDSLSVVEEVIKKAMEPIPALSCVFDQRNKPKDICDPERAALYARVALKSVRYRNTHPEIDCAAILSNMMSYRVAELAFQCIADKEKTIVKKLNYFLKNVFDVKTYEELKEGDSSYFPARELSLLSLSDYDEMIYSVVRLNKNEVSCVDLCSFYIAILRLLGFSAEHAFLITQPFHYLAAVRVNDAFLIISLNEVMFMSKNRLYGDTDLERIITPVLYAQNGRESNMPPQFLERMKEILINEIPVFTEMKVSESLKETPVEAEDFPVVSDFGSVLEFHNAMLQYVYNQSSKYPDSPFTWGKYSYQTILVDKPQAYIIASMNSIELKQFVKKYDSFLSVTTWLQEECKTESIYLEEDRIMTSDQVIRNGTGGHKDRAIFLYAALKGLSLFVKGLVCINRKSSYVVFSDLESQNRIIINSLDCSIHTNLPENNVLIINEKERLTRNDMEHL